MRCNSLKLNIYYLAFKSSFYPQKSQFVHFLLKRGSGILYLNGHVTYDLPKPQNGIMGTQNPNLGPKNIFQGLPGLYSLFLAAILEICKLAD